MSEPRWEEREPDVVGMLAEARRLLSRARQRWILWLALAVALSAVIGVREYRKQRNYPASVVLSITEGERADDGIAHANSRLQDYVWYAVFTDHALMDLMTKYDFRPDLLTQNPRLALEQFRDRIDLAIYKNEFTAPRYPGSPPRSARLAIEFRHPDPDTALAIARDLGDLVVNRDAENRRARIDAQQRIAADTVRYAEADVNRLSRRQESIESDLEFATGDEFAKLVVARQGNRKGMEEALARLKDASDKKQRLDFRKSSDEESLELMYDRVEWGAPALEVNVLTSTLKAALGAFFAILPLLGLVIGAFDSRVYDEDDVGRLGLRTLGVVRLGGRRARTRST
ncbi:MAG: hypothetical protein U0271_18885 [Polyangiaceae bacterium]